MKQNFTHKGLARLYFIMRVSLANLLLIFIPCLQVLSAKSHGQSTKDTFVSIEVSKASMSTIFEMIEDQTDFMFVFSPDIVEKYTDYSFSTRRIRLSDFLSRMFKEADLKYKEDGLIIIIYKDKSGSTPATVKSEYQQISGLVTDKTGRGLPGVNILIKGTLNGTSSDSDGKFTINASETDVLVFSFIGFKMIEVGVGNKTMLNVSMEEDVETLSEVTINAGYYTLKDKEQVGNISRVGYEDIQTQPVINPLQALQGRMPGVYLNQQNGLPGGNLSIQIRGRNSLRYEGNDPLYVIDGVPFPSTTLSSAFVGSPLVAGTSPMNSINPNDIESIEVLKDADATAIYGSRGSNGVILVTTKRGGISKTNIDISYSEGWGDVSNKIKLLSTEQYIEMRKEAFKNDNEEMQIWTAADILAWDTTRYTDWQDKLIGGTARFRNSQVSFSGGNENTQYLVSGGYYGQSTVYPGGFKFYKISNNFNIHHVSDDRKLDILLTGNFSTDNNDLPMLDLTRQALNLPPNAPSLYTSSGDLNWENSTWSNPIAILNSTYNSKTDNLVGGFNISYNLVKKLFVKTRLGYNSIRMNEISKDPYSSHDPAYQQYYTRTSKISNSDIKSWIVEPQVDFEFNLGDGVVKALLGGTLQNRMSNSETISASGFSSDALLDNLKAATSVTISNDVYAQYKYAALFGRLNYSYRSKYIVNITGRRDGSSRFGPGKQFSNFGAVGFAWILSNEAFLKDVNWMTFAKIRSSYGVTGNDQIPDYGYLETYNPTGNSYGIATLIPTRLANPDYAWEKNRKFEVGLELGLMQDRILFSSSFYHNLMTDQLVGYPLSLVAGQSSIQYNSPATVRNNGWELELATKNVRGNSFYWNSNFNITIPTTVLLSYPNIEGSIFANQYTVGRSMNLLKTYHYLGVNSETGLYSFEDLNGNGSGTDYPFDYKSVKMIGQRFYGGVLNTFIFRQIQLDVFVQFVKQSAKDATATAFGSQPGTMSNQPEHVMSRWKEPGDISDYQKFSQSYGDVYFIYDNSISSDKTVSDASFIRLKNVSLSYSVSKLAEKLNLRDIRAYVQGQNLFTISRYEGLDPENLDSSVLPPLRMITVGFNVLF